MTTELFGIIIVGLLILTACIYIKMVLIWKDVMLKRNEQTKKDIKRLQQINRLID